VPYTEQQVRLFMSKGSPLNATEKEKVRGELHADPGMGHKKPGPAATPESRQRYARYKSRRGQQ
jgi:hypothetical protein